MFSEDLKTHAVNPIYTISSSVNSEIIYLFLIYDYCELRTICPPSLVVGVSDYGTGGLGSISWESAHI